MLRERPPAYTYTFIAGRILAVVDVSPNDGSLTTVRDLIAVLETFPGNWKLEGLHRHDQQVRVYLDDVSSEPVVFIDG